LQIEAFKVVLSDLESEYRYKIFLYFSAAALAQTMSFGTACLSWQRVLKLPFKQRRRAMARSALAHRSLDPLPFTFLSLFSTDFFMCLRARAHAGRQIDYVKFLNAELLTPREEEKL
jgi:hypothetical protein